MLVIRPRVYESQLDVILEWLQRVQKPRHLLLLVAIQTIHNIFVLRPDTGVEYTFQSFFVPYSRLQEAGIADLVAPGQGSKLALYHRVAQEHDLGSSSFSSCGERLEKF